MKNLLVMLLVGICAVAKAQVPVEIFAGNDKATVDLMFFKFFKNRQHENSRWLFFNRNRASIDYRMTKTAYLPQFGLTEAISYNHEKLKGFAPVLVGQVLSWGVYAKTGVQYARIRKDFTLFTWLVVETARRPDFDYFLLVRYTPRLSEKLHLFAQAESVNAFPTENMANYSFTQRLRLGFKRESYQFGAGADFSQTGNKTFVSSRNVGAFIRHEF